MDFRSELETIINRYSKENGSNTPDFILAEYLDDCLAAFDKASKRRTKWCAPERQPDLPAPVGPAPTKKVYSGEMGALHFPDEPHKWSDLVTGMAETPKDRVTTGGHACHTECNCIRTSYRTC